MVYDSPEKHPYIGDEERQYVREKLPDSGKVLFDTCFSWGSKTAVFFNDRPRAEGRKSTLCSCVFEPLRWRQLSTMSISTMSLKIADIPADVLVALP